VVCWYIFFVMFFKQYLVTRFSRQHWLYNVNKFGTTFGLTLQPKFFPLILSYSSYLGTQFVKKHQFQVHGCYLTMICRLDVVVTWPSFVSWLHHLNLEKHVGHFGVQCIEQSIQAWQHAHFKHSNPLQFLLRIFQNEVIARAQKNQHVSFKPFTTH
jgi:hypothetical protein